MCEGGEYGSELFVGCVVEGEGEVDGADFLLVGALLAVGAGRPVVEILSDAFEVEDVSAVQIAEIVYQFLQTDGAGGHFVQVLRKHLLLGRFLHCRLT